MLGLYPEDVFQFPLLGFLLCITRIRLRFGLGRSVLSIPFIGIFALHQGSSYSCDVCWLVFQFPLLGFLLCIRNRSAFERWLRHILSIPFIGIFALHLWILKLSRLIHITAFNSLYWDFCFASGSYAWWKVCACWWLSIPFIGIFALHQACRWDTRTSLKTTFNSLYWDFCFASSEDELAAATGHTRFQFPLLGFLLCIPQGSRRRWRS